MLLCVISFCFVFVPHLVWLEGTLLPTRKGPVLIAEARTHPQNQGTALPCDVARMGSRQPMTIDFTAH